MIKIPAVFAILKELTLPNDNHSPGTGPGRLVPRGEHYPLRLQQRRDESLEVHFTL